MTHGDITGRPTTRRLFNLVEPIGTLPFGNHALGEVVEVLGLRNIWDAYFAGRAAALVRVPADVVHALFYNFFPGEAARHIPRVWDLTTPEAAIRARDDSCARRLRHALGVDATTSGLARTTDLLTRAALHPPSEGRPMYAALRALPLPEEPETRLFRAASMLREYRGDGHIAVLISHGVGGTESHFLAAVAEGMPGAHFGRVHHRPRAELETIEQGPQSRGLIDTSGRITAAGQDTKDRIESLTDQLAQPPYDALSDSELSELVTGLESITDRLAVGAST